MAKLLNDSKNILIPDLKKALHFFSRAKGLLGTRELAPSSGLFISNCNSVHTFFMKYAIDCVFVDKNLKVKGVKQNLAPHRATFPIWGASAVIELSAGSIAKFGIKKGDQLYVVD